MNAAVTVAFLALSSVSFVAQAKQQDPTCFVTAYITAAARFESVTKETVGQLVQDAKAGDKVAQTALAMLYTDGGLVPMDLDSAIHWAAQAAASGNAADRELLQYMKWIRGAEKASQADHTGLIREGAETGLKFFQYMYAEMANSGAGKRDAVPWYEKAAAQGCMDARTKLSAIHAGDDRIKAYMWISLVDYANAFDGRMRNELEYDELRARKEQARLRRTMALEEVAKAERLASEWAKQHGEPYPRRTWADDSIVYLTDQNLAAEIQRTKGYLAVHFTSFDENCPPCLSSNTAVDDLSQRYRGKLTFARVNFEPWWEKHPTISPQYKIVGLPVVVLFKNGKETNRWLGSNLEAISSQLDKCCAR